MSMQPQARTPTTSEIYHALLRPAILQILRAQGYYASTPGTIDTLTELAGAYMTTISRQTAAHAARNNGLGPEASIVDVRMALEDCGALWPRRDFSERDSVPGDDGGDEDDDVGDEEDTRGVDEFIRWAKGKKNLRIRKVAGLDKPVVASEENEVEEQETDYLSGRHTRHLVFLVSSCYARENHTIYICQFG